MAYNQQLADALRNNDMNAYWNALYTSGELIHKDIAFDPQWANGTGYYDGAVKAKIPELEVGQVGRSIAPGENKRRILIMKTQFGNIVIFERYTPEKDGRIKGPILAIMSDVIYQSEMVGTDSLMSAERLDNIFGVSAIRENVALRLSAFLQTVKMGGRISRGMRFRRLEALLVFAGNFNRVIDVIRNSITSELAITNLTGFQLYAPDAVKDAHKNNHIPHRTDGFGLVGNDLKYRLTHWQAELIVKTPLIEVSGQNLDIIDNAYQSEASAISSDCLKMAEDLEAEFA